jgi:hypothetical protein
VHDYTLPVTFHSTEWAAQNLNDSSTIHESPSILLSPSSSQSESLSLGSKFLRKSKFLMKSESNVNIENSVNCSPSSMNDLLPKSESSDRQQIAAESDMKPITLPLALAPTLAGLVQRDDKTLRAIKLEDSDDKDPAFKFSTPLSPINHSPPSPLMEIIPPPLSHRLQVTNPLESATAVASSNSNTTSTQELQSLSEIQHTPCRLAISILAFSCPTQI